MKRTFLINVIVLMIGLLLTNNFSYSNTNTEYLIEGNIKGLPDGVAFSLISSEIKKEPDTLQRVNLKNGVFLFKLKNLVIGKIYFIILDKTGLKLPDSKINWIRLIIEEPSVRIFGNIDQWPVVTIIGSGATKVYEEYQKGNKAHYSKYVTFMNALPPLERSKASKDFYSFIKNDTNALTKAFKENEYEDWKVFVQNYIRNNNASSITPYLIMKSIVLSLVDKNNAYATLPDKSKNSYYGGQLKSYLVAEKLRREVVLGKPIPDFNLTTPDGKIVSIRSLVGKHKLTLIDFWASWCSPCRSAIPHLKDIYHKFNSRGLNIIGITTAKNDKEIAWKKAISADNTPWDQGMDMKNASDVFFPKDAIPGYLLIDRSGNIIASHLIDGGKGLGTQGPKITGEALARTVEQLLNTL